MDKRKIDWKAFQVKCRSSSKAFVQARSQLQAVRMRQSIDGVAWSQREDDIQKAELIMQIQIQTLATVKKIEGKFYNWLLTNLNRVRDDYYAIDSSVLVRAHNW